MTKQFLNDAKEMIANIRVSVGEGSVLNKEDINATAFGYNSEISRADGIKEMLDYITYVKEEEEK